MSERGDIWKFMIILLVLWSLMMVLVNQYQSDWIRDLQRRIAVLEQERR